MCRPPAALSPCRRSPRGPSGPASSTPSRRAAPPGIRGARGQSRPAVGGGGGCHSTRSRSSGASGCARPTRSSACLRDHVDKSLSTPVWNPVDSGSPVPTRQRLVIGRRSGRLVEKLSPGMCTGWGDPSRCRSGNAAPAPPPARQRRQWGTRYAAELGFRPIRPADPRTTTRTDRPSCTRHGDEQGATRGVEVDEQRSLCTAVELSTCRQQTDADHPQRANRPGGRLTCGKGPGPQLPHV